MILKQTECVTQKTEEMSESKDNRRNLAVKHAMAEELLGKGLHPRSVERLLNIRLERQLCEKINKKKKSEDNHER